MRPPACRGWPRCCRPTAGCCGWASCSCCRSITSQPAWSAASGRCASTKETSVRQSKNRLLSWTAAIALPLLLAACGGGGGSGDEQLKRQTHLGEVRGSADPASLTWSWKGIPYAKAPVGALRWQPPQEPEAWTTARPATAFGAACAQYGRIYGPGANNRYDETIGTTLNQAVGSEDCLYLNVWRPATIVGNLPVI